MKIENRKGEWREKRKGIGEINKYRGRKEKKKKGREGRRIRKMEGR